MNPEANKNTADLTKPKNTLGNIFSSSLFYLTILLFIIGFNFSDRMAGNWYQQFLPSIGSQQINDIIFLDSLTGYAVTSRNVNPDTASILKTTNGGDNWQVIFTQTPKRLTKIQFINQNTGFACGGSGGGTPQLYKTTNAGGNWFLLSSFGCALWDDMFVLNNDTIWLVDDNSLCGGVFRTTDSGASWQQQLSLGSQNPNHIYMYNARIGFVSNNTGTYLRKTTDSGLSWNTVFNRGFNDIFFIDSLKGWSAFDSVRVTTNGGLNWQTQILPSGLGIDNLFSTRFSHLNTDTIWIGGGRYTFPNGQSRGMIFRTVNEGSTWLYQTPDTAIHAGIYSHVQFVDKNKGWANTGFVQIHTTTGGDPVWVTPINQISSEVPKEYNLFQNYPNPFNPVTNIKYSIMSNVKSAFGGQMSNVKLTLYDITGKEVIKLIDEEQGAGIYKVDWNASGFSSGIYFYSLIVNGALIDTKKMILLK